MLKNIIIRELQHFIYSTRFHLALALIIFMYAVSTISFIKEYDEQMENYERVRNAQKAYLKQQADESATQVAIQQKRFLFPPRAGAFISSGKEQSIPNIIVYSAYNVFGYETATGKTNPFLLPSEDVNWQFILIMLFSFLAIIFSFDTISGEKEQKTLLLGLSNSLPRSQLLLGKYIAIVFLLTVFTLIGTLLSISIFLISGKIIFSGLVLFEVAGFLLQAFLLIATMSALGILCSVLCYQSNISLLIGLTAWMFFMFIIPNSAVLLSDTLYPVDRKETVQENTNKDRDAIEKSYPDGKWSSRGDDLFYERHEIRAAMQMDFMLNRKKHFDHWYNQQFLQYEAARIFHYISPLGMFEYGTEKIVDGGYTRFRKNWEGMHNYQERLLAFFKEIDGNDKESPHWYNPFENFSTTREKVSVEEIPQYTEPITSVSKRSKEMIIYLGMLGGYAIVFLLLAGVRFYGYDVR